MQAKAKPEVVVVGVDYAETGELALRHGLEIASTAPGGEVHAVHVATTLAMSLGLEHGPEAMPPIAPNETEADVQRYVDRRLFAFTSERDPRAPLPARVVAHLRFDSPAHEIARLARELEAHLVVVGTRGRRGLARMVTGSVAESVVRLSPCPVLVVRPKDETPVPRIEPACEHCVRTRIATGGKRLWCRQHSETHGPRHTYHQGDRIAADGGMPLVFHE